MIQPAFVLIRRRHRLVLERDLLEARLRGGSVQAGEGGGIALWIGLADAADDEVHRAADQHAARRAVELIVGGRSQRLEDDRDQVLERELPSEDVRAFE